MHLSKLNIPGIEIYKKRQCGMHFCSCTILNVVIFHKSAVWQKFMTRWEFLQDMEVVGIS